MRLRGFRACVWPWTMALAAAGLWLMLPVAVPAQTGSESKGELGLPSTTIAPAEGETPQAPPPVTTHHRTPAPAIHHPHVSSAMTAPVKSVPVEPAQAKVLLKQDTWIYAQPSNKSAHVEKGEKGKFVMVTGSTHYFLRVKLKNGQDGYVMADAVEISRHMAICALQNFCDTAACISLDGASHRTELFEASASSKSPTCCRKTPTARSQTPNSWSISTRFAPW